MTWIFNTVDHTEIPPKAVGFVYLMVDLETGKRYIGKKNYYATKTIQRNKKKKKLKVESNWREYNSSSEEINQLVEQGVEFYKEILRVCYSKSEMSYYETKYQFDNDVLLHPNLWYNKWMAVKITSRHCQSFSE